MLCSVAGGLLPLTSRFVRVAWIFLCGLDILVSSKLLGTRYFGAGYFRLDIFEAGYFGAETLKVNTLEAGLNSTAVMSFTRPEVTLQESVTCRSHSLGFRKRNLALDCWPLTIFNFI